MTVAVVPAEVCGPHPRGWERRVTGARVVAETVARRRVTQEGVVRHQEVEEDRRETQGWGEPCRTTVAEAVAICGVDACREGEVWEEMQEGDARWGDAGTGCGMGGVQKWMRKEDAGRGM